MSRRNAPFYSFPPQQSIPQLWLQYEMELPFLLYIYTDWSIFHRGTSTDTFYNFYILYIGPTYVSRIYRKSLVGNIFIFLIWEKFVVSSVCWFASVCLTSIDGTKSTSLCSAAIFQLFFRWRRNCSNLLMQAKRNNLWEKIFLEENKTLSNKL